MCSRASLCYGSLRGKDSATEHSISIQSFVLFLPFKGRCPKDRGVFYDSLFYEQALVKDYQIKDILKYHFIDGLG